jgi:hypothetical protein
MGEAHVRQKAIGFCELLDEVGSGEWGVGSGEWGVGSGEWVTPLVGWASCPPSQLASQPASQPASQLSSQLANSPPL